ncbi:MAG: OmpA family protein [Gammaproteobacteria bacterium]|nr:OmpA family protein [Gammaproteobacteria bacterium]
MKMKVLVLALGLVTTAAYAADDFDYAKNSSGTVWRNSSGECWNMGWRDENFKELPECTGEVPVAEPVAAAPEPAAEPEPAPVAAAAPVVYTFDNITFENNSAELKAEAKPVLDDVANRINNAEKEIQRINVVGHTDSSGAAAYNKDLSQRRAQSVVEYLEVKGVSAPLTAEGRGEEQPVADNATREGRAQNRRVEFEVFQ